LSTWYCKEKKIRLTSRGQPVDYPYFPAITQTNLSSVKLCFSSSQDDCFRAVWNAAPLQSFNEFCASKSRYVLLQITVLAVCTVQDYFVFLLLLPPSFLAPNAALHCKLIPKFVTGLICPTDHRHPQSARIIL